MNAQFKDIQNRVDAIVKGGELHTQLYQTADGIANIISTIQRTKGDNWAVQVLDEKGQPILTPDEQQQFTEAFRPYIEHIVSFLGDRQKGGQAPTQAPVTPEYDIPDVESLTQMSKNNIDSKMNSIGRSGDTEDPEKMTGVDNIYAKVVQRLGSINSAVNNYASKHGVLQMEKKSDMEPDVRLIPQPIAQLISKGLMLASVPPNVSMEFMNKIKVPFRLIVFVIYLFLDVARVTASVTGSDSNRKILSIVLSVVDLLKGDWKKAVLSFMGYYGTTPLLMGQMFKIYLAMFQALSPTIQDSIIYGALDTTKSFAIGILLAIFKLTAPEGVRLPLIGMLEKIAAKKAEIDGVLTGAGLSARSDSFSPTFEDFNNIQALMDDPEFICSTEFETLIEQVNNTAIINMILQILRIPVTKEFRAYRCGTKPSRPFLTLIVNKAKEDKEKQEILDRPLSEEDLDMPVSVAPAQEEKTETQEQQSEEKIEEPVIQEQQMEEKTEEKTEEPVTQEQQTEEKQSEEKVEEAPLPSVIAPEPKKGGTRRKRHVRSRSRKIRAHR